jgi:hypothetical protein
MPRPARAQRRQKSSKISLSDDLKAIIKSDRVQPHEIPEERASSLWKWLHSEGQAHDVAEDSLLVLAVRSGRTRWLRSSAGHRRASSSPSTRRPVSPVSTAPPSLV